MEAMSFLNGILSIEALKVAINNRTLTHRRSVQIINIVPSLNRCIAEAPSVDNDWDFLDRRTVLSQENKFQKNHQRDELHVDFVIVFIHRVWCLGSRAPSTMRSVG